jgi:CDP-4-dehydro-6-deoxyglucose reductase, E1
MKNYKIPLVNDTISDQELFDLADWIKTIPKLTKGPLNNEFEELWSKWLNTKHSVFVNSGSSANLLMIDVLKESGRLKSKNIIVPAVSWSTTVAPVIQLGLNPILCDADPKNLGLNLDHLKELLSTQDIGAIVIVHVLGVPNHMVEIIELCEKYDVILLEDCCESHGSEYQGSKVGTFGLMSTFSFFYGHHISTIEGGMISTSDQEINELLILKRAHGWVRDLPGPAQEKYTKEFDTSDFESLYSFYTTGYNVRSNDVSAFLGLSQMKNIDKYGKIRNDNYKYYKKLLKDFWAQDCDNSFISNFSYGMLLKDRDKVASKLMSNGIECRPLICGSIGQQPFWIKLYGKCSLPIADRVHKEGLYLPNNPKMKFSDIDFIGNVLNEYKEE